MGFIRYIFVPTVGMALSSPYTFATLYIFVSTGMS